jgi:diguanylate cyclase (GGDEF)-like protein
VFNERFGIDAGDDMLKAIADVTAETVTPSGGASSLNLVSRIGGEEFAVLLVENERGESRPSAEDAVATAEKLRAAIESVRVEDAGVTVSVGVASMPEHGATADELLDAADTALALAIDSGGNVVVAAAQNQPESPSSGQAE